MKLGQAHAEIKRRGRKAPLKGIDNLRFIVFRFNSTVNEMGNWKVPFLFEVFIKAGHETLDKAL